MNIGTGLDVAGRVTRTNAVCRFAGSGTAPVDIDQFTAVINPPEAGILAIGSIVEKTVVVDGAVTPRRRLRITMSCDHRVIDGATGAAFLKTLKLMLENPLAMLL